MQQNVGQSLEWVRALLMLVAALSLGPVVGCETGDDSLGDDNPELLLDEEEAPVYDGGDVMLQSDASVQTK